MSRPSAEVRSEIGRKLIGLPPIDVAHKRRSPVKDLTTLRFCDQFNNWVGRRSGQGARWTDDLTWVLVQDVLRQDGLPPLARAASHLLALRGPYVATSRATTDSVQTLGELVGVSSSTLTDGQIDGLFSTNSMLRRRFVAPIVSAALNRPVPPNQINERSDGSKMELSASLASIVEAFFDALQRKMHNLDFIGWESMMPDSAPVGITWVDDAAARDLPLTQAEILNRHSYVTIELLFQLTLSLERLYLAALIAWRQFQLVGHFSKEQVSDSRAAASNPLLEGDAAFVPALDDFLKISALIGQLDQTFDGRTLLRTIGMSITGFRHFWSIKPGLASLALKQFDRTLGVRWSVTVDRLRTRREFGDLFDETRLLVYTNQPSEIRADDTGQYTPLSVLRWLFLRLAPVFPDDVQSLARIEWLADDRIGRYVNQLVAAGVVDRATVRQAVDQALAAGADLWTEWAPDWLRESYPSGSRQRQPRNITRYCAMTKL